MTTDLETTKDFITHYLGDLDQRQLSAVEDILRTADYPRPGSHKITGLMLKQVASLLEAEVSGSSTDIHKSCSELAALCIHRISTLK